MRTRSAKYRHQISKAFESEFALEVLRSDQLRVTILIGVLLSAVTVVFVLMFFSFDQFQRAFHGNIRGFLISVSTLVGLNLAWLVIERILIDYRIRKQRSITFPIQLFSAFIETSIPTIGMLIGSMYLGPVYTLFTPAVFIYPLFIVVSALRLDFRLCVFTGAVAGLEYLTLALYLISKGSTASVEPILVGTPHHVF